MSRALLDAARALLAQLPGLQHRTYPTYHARLEVDALRRAVEAHEAALAKGRPTNVRTESGELVAVTLTDDDHRVLATVWERAT